MHDNRRWVFISILVGGLVVWGVMFLLMRQVNVTFRLSSMIPYGDVVVNAIPVVVAGLLFLWVYRSANRMVFCDEVVGEIRKVTWPTRKDITASTIVVIITIVIIAAILGLYDAVCSWVIQRII